MRKGIIAVVIAIAIGALLAAISAWAQSVPINNAGNNLPFLYSACPNYSGVGALPVTDEGGGYIKFCRLANGVSYQYERFDANNRMVVFVKPINPGEFSIVHQPSAAEPFYGIKIVGQSQTIESHQDVTFKRCLRLPTCPFLTGPGETTEE